MDYWSLSKTVESPFRPLGGPIKGRLWKVSEKHLPVLVINAIESNIFFFQKIIPIFFFIFLRNNFPTEEDRGRVEFLLKVSRRSWNNRWCLLSGVENQKEITRGKLQMVNQPQIRRPDSIYLTCNDFHLPSGLMNHYVGE